MNGIAMSSTGTAAYYHDRIQEEALLLIKKMGVHEWLLIEQSFGEPIEKALFTLEFHIDRLAEQELERCIAISN